MKVLIIQERGHHAENETFRESLCMCRALKRMAAGFMLDIRVCGPGYYSYSHCREWAQRWADVVLCLENYERSGWVPDLSAARAYTVFWSIDSHVRFGPHVSFAKKHKFHLVLSSTAEIVPQWKREGFNARWFPNAYPADLIDRRTDVAKQHDVGFCGLFPGTRRRWYEKIGRGVPIHYDTFVIGESMVRAVNGYRVHLNRNVRNDVNYRTFETPGCGTFLLTNKTDRLADLFDIGKHLVTYDGDNDCIQKARYYAEHEQEREKIARHGYMHVRACHTYDNRARQFVDMMKEVV